MKASENTKIKELIGKNFAEHVRFYPFRRVAAAIAFINDEDKFKIDWKKFYTLDELPKLEQGQWFVPAIFCGFSFRVERILPDDETILRDHDVSGAWHFEGNGVERNGYGGKEFFQQELEDLSNLIEGQSISENLASELCNHYSLDEEIDIEAWTDMRDKLLAIMEGLKDCSDEKTWEMMARCYEAGQSRTWLSIPQSCRLFSANGSQATVKEYNSIEFEEWQEIIIEKIKSDPYIEPQILKEYLDGKKNKDGKNVISFNNEGVHLLGKENPISHDTFRKDVNRLKEKYFEFYHFLD